MRPVSVSLRWYLDFVTMILSILTNLLTSHYCHYNSEEVSKGLTVGTSKVSSRAVTSAAGSDFAARCLVIFKCQLDISHLILFLDVRVFCVYRVYSYSR